MIYTLTTNPAIDMNISTMGIKRKEVNRTFDTVYSANGKGLNVSFVLKYFGLDSTVMGFFGGFSGDYIIKETKKKGINIIPTMIEDEITRINIFLNDGEGEFKFVNSGSFVDSDKQEEMLNVLRNLNDLEYLTINGSLPPGIDPDYYDKILNICKEKETKVIIDISSPKLKELLKYKPFLIKPNDEEIKDILGIEITNKEDVIKVLEFLYKSGAQNIFLTMGEKGSYFYNGENIYFATAQKVKLMSSACAGDSALAGFLSIWLENPDNIEKALKRASATGANVAESNAIGNLKKVEEYTKNIKVRRVG